MTNQSLNLGSIQLMSVVNAMKTGDPTMDMLLAILMPYIVSRLMNDITREIKRFINSYKTKTNRQVYNRVIVYDSSENNLNGSPHNSYLIRGILLYMHKHCQLDMTSAEFYLAVVEDQNANQKRQRLQRSGRDGTLDLLEAAEVSEKPMVGEFLRVGKFADNQVSVKLMDSSREKKKEDDASTVVRANSRRIEIHLQSNTKKAIQTFVETAHKFFIEELNALQNNARYMYDLQSIINQTTYNSFELGEEKTFDNLFSRQSNELLGIVDQFQAKKGKYAIKGYPHKLGLLLSGPPGTGKTSLIKALSHYTNRHIVNIALNRIATNAQFMQVFFNKQYKDLNGTILTANVAFSDVIFVLEDLDASSDVVFRRDNAAKATPKEITKEESNLGDESDSDIKWKKRVDPASNSDTLDMQNVRKMLRSQAKATQSSINADKLNLSGILNVLDGVVETPGRIVIMTTNHPELLDPALIRPGRIDRHIHMGMMELDDIVAMFHHFCPGSELTDDQKSDLEGLLNQKGITPAQVEQLLSEVETAESFLDKMKSRLEHKDVITTSEGSTEVESDSEECTA